MPRVGYIVVLNLIENKAVIRLENDSSSDIYRALLPLKYHVRLVNERMSMRQAIELADEINATLEYQLWFMHSCSDRLVVAAAALVRGELWQKELSPGFCTRDPENFFAGGFTSFQQAQDTMAIFI